MLRLASLAVVLFFFWLGLSGYFKPFLLIAGVCSALFCAFLAARMRIVDTEGLPIHLSISAVTYWPWLYLEIIKSALNVSRIIIDPRLPISPVMTDVVASQKTTVGRATYANSITLTPGTITAGVEGNILTVHALTREGADDLEAGGMDARVRRFEGER